ncbi:MAG: L-lysine 2,3-aminomutase [Candidatus Methanolliviera sp. GoM_oil]|nr:MAG: L-lysine 2,3-aminomutase [Candidatus Methanolliviera sp. GoM_oil]
MPFAVFKRMFEMIFRKKRCRGYTLTWEDELEEAVCTIEQLKQYIELIPKEEEQLQKVIKRHPMRVTRYYISLIDWSNPNDPIRRMAIPSEGELDLSGSYDTSGELENTKLIGLQHKYSQTALVLTTNKCASYCRYCFRKRLVGLPNKEVVENFGTAVGYIREHSEINNVLISGGDPFILPTEIIKEFLEMLSDIPHLFFIRFGTKVPVIFPERISEDEELLTLLKKYSLKDRRIYVVTQFNHPTEITNRSIESVDRLISSNVIINNQSVLLKGVNDNPDILAELQNKLVSIGVNPYYIFQCRPVKRAKKRFQVPLYSGNEIIEDAKKKINGHSKRFRYIMSHQTGKIEILGIMDDYIYLKYHQAKDHGNIGKIFKRKINKRAGWLDDLD